MKKFWIVLLALGLIAAFSMPAAATEVKLGGSYFVAGYYEDNMELRDAGPSAAWYAQRIRFEPVFQVAEGLTFIMRIDAMERVWGQYAIGSEATPTGLNKRNIMAEQNVMFSRGYAVFATGIGRFVVGHLAAAAWGTDFQDQPIDGSSIIFVTKLGPIVAKAVAQKIIEGRLGYTPVLNAGNVDSDTDKYAIAFDYPWDKGIAGAMWVRIHSATFRPKHNLMALGVAGEYKSEIDLWCAYFKSTFGPLYMEGEWMWSTGAAKDWDDHVTGKPNVDQEGMTYYLMAKYNIGPTYVGAQYGFSAGDDPYTADKVESYASPGYGMWNPTLILFSDWLDRWRGALGPAAYNAQTTNLFTNVSLYQVFGGYNPTPKLGIKASYTMANADVKPLDPSSKKEFLDDDYGTEFDLTVSYKIYDNLEYMVGFGYLWTGDYYKGANASGKIDDNYLLMHQLTLTF